MFSRYSVLSEDYNPDKPAKPRSTISKPPSFRPRKALPNHQPGQICLVKESTFKPLCEALQLANGPLDIRKGTSLTVNPSSGRLDIVSSGIERPCIIMEPPPGYQHPKGHRRKGHFVCVMATFALSGGQYERFGRLLQHFVVPIEPNPQLLPDSEMYALKTYPPWRHPWQWTIGFILYTEQSVRPYTSLDGKSRRLSSGEYTRLEQRCSDQLRSWLSATEENENLRQDLYDELVVS